MVSFDVTSLYGNIPIIDALNIIKDYVNNDDQFTRKTAIPQDKFLDLVNLVLTTTWYTFNSQLYQQTDGVAMGGPASSTIAEIYIQAHEQTAISTALHPPKVWERFVENFYFHINNLHQNVKFTMEEESNGEIAFLNTLLNWNNRKPAHTDQCLHYSSHHQTSCKESVVSSLLNNPRIKRVLKENGYQENIISKIFKRIANNLSLPQSQQQMQVTDIQEEEIE